MNCQYCGNIHGGMCPRIKTIEYYANGQVKRIEFRDQDPPAAPMQLVPIYPGGGPYWPNTPFWPVVFGEAGQTSSPDLGDLRVYNAGSVDWYATTSGVEHTGATLLQ